MRRIRQTKLCGLLLFSISLFCQAEPVVTSAPDYQLVIKQLSEFIDDVVDDENIPGLSIALLDGEHIVWSDGFGYADVENKVDAKAYTVYRQGAVTTTLTAFAIMQLVQQGKVELDAPLTKYLPQFSMIMPEGQSLEAITIRRLLSHHAGLPISFFKGMWTEQPESLAQLQNRLNEVAVSFPVDQVYAYSNLGYDLLGRVIEVVSGQPFADYMQQKILTPLAMNSSSFKLTEKLQQQLAAGYKKDELKPMLPTRDLPAVGLYASVEDIALFVAQLMQRGGDVMLAERFRRQMISPQNSGVPLDLNKQVGFAWQMSQLPVAPEYQLVWRQGASLTHRNRVAFLPELNLGVVVSANSSRAFRGMEKISEEALRLMLQARVGELPAQDPAALPALPGKPEEFANAYAGFLGLLQVEKDGDEYELDLMGWDFDLVPRGDGWYRVQYALFGFIPIKLDWIAKVSVAATTVEGRRVAIVSYHGVNYLFAQALAPLEVDESWLKRLGRYEPAEMDALLQHYDVSDGKLKYEDGYYFFEYKLPYWVPLRFRLPMVPIAGDAVRVPGLGTALGERISFDDHGRAWYSGYELKRVD